MKKALVISLLAVVGLGIAAFAGWHFEFEQSLLGAPTLPWGPPPCEVTFGFAWVNSTNVTQDEGGTLVGVGPFIVEGDIYVGNPDMWAFMPAEWGPGLDLYFEWYGAFGLNLESEWLLGLLPSPDFWVLKDWTSLVEAVFIINANARLILGADIVFVPGPPVNQLDLEPYFAGEFTW